MPSITAATLADLPLTLPPLTAQLSIVEILDAFDEKVAVHRQAAQLTQDAKEICHLDKRSPA